MDKLFKSHMLVALLGVLSVGQSNAQNAGQNIGQDTAQETAPASNLRLNGFGTLGLVSDHVNFEGSFRREISQSSEPNKRLRAHVDSRIGVQANYTISPKIELVGQAVLKDRPLGNRFNDAVEWAFASFRPTPDITLRVGRTSPDLFLLSDTRNVGFSYVAARPPVDFYGFLSFPKINGFDVTKTWTVEDAQWRAKVFSGDSTFPLMLSSSQAFTADLHSFKGLVLSREGDGLLVRATVARSTLEVDPGNQLKPVIDGLNALSGLPVPSVASQAQDMGSKFQTFGTVFTYTSLGAAYDGGKWLAASEAMTLQSGNPIASVKAGYVTVGRRQGDITLHSTASLVRSASTVYGIPNWVGALTPILGAAGANAAQQLGSTTAMLLNNWRIDQRTLSLGMRWDFDPRIALKAQWDRSWIASNGSLMWVGGKEASRADVVTLLVDFVF